MKFGFSLLAFFGETVMYFPMLFFFFSSQTGPYEHNGKFCSYVVRVWGQGPTSDSSCPAQVFVKLSQGKSLIMKSSCREI